LPTSSTPLELIVLLIALAVSFLSFLSFLSFSSLRLAGDTREPVVIRSSSAPALGHL
jgi:hypothetical protein